MTIKLKPDFWKGYTRKATPLYMMDRFAEAKEVYLQGLKVSLEFLWSKSLAFYEFWFN
jgi:hypothetical protein